MLNADKTMVLTSQGQPPLTITTQHGITVKSRQATSHRNGWVACYLHMDRNKKAWICDTISSKRQKRIMPTNRFWRNGGFLLLSVSAILIPLFHRLLALQVGSVPFTRNTYNSWTFIFENFADPL